MSHLNGLVHSPKTIDMPYQEITASVSQGDCEEESGAFDLCSTIP
jgi:hypothetical protein